MDDLCLSGPICSSTVSKEYWLNSAVCSSRYFSVFSWLRISPSRISVDATTTSRISGNSI